VSPPASLRRDRGLDTRLQVLNLDALLVHVRLFGGAYLGRVAENVIRYG
jgi:hypothetical protein